MSITAADVNKLRQITGAGMMDCKKALVEANGDFEAAIDYLRKKGQKIAANRADREAAEGVVVAITDNANKKGVVVRISCETDFVAKNEDFVNFAKAIAHTALDKYPADKDALLQLSVDGKNIASALEEQVAKIGEKIELAQYETLEAPTVVPYIHMGYKIGVLVGLNEAASDTIVEAGKDTAMQIAALNPIAVSKDDVPQEVMERELRVGKEQAIEEGKPEAMAEKIAQGRLQKFFKDNTLLSQQFVKDGNLTVEQALKQVDKGLSVTKFVRVSLG
ncbi:MAG: translation elongation factor Ts [Chitinophagales bacterium]|nr:elongation factor Ts [Bacteroidota bacterium]